MQESVSRAARRCTTAAEELCSHRHDEKGLNWEPGWDQVRSRGPQFRSESGVDRIIRYLGVRRSAGCA